jgi:ADP-dependent NAD(P)H-hydrate dehydratase
MNERVAPAPTVITPEVLRAWPLPQPDEGGDEEERGRVLVVGGSVEMPGAVMLAATAALRAGAGKLRVATVRSVAAGMALAVPEARVFALPETEAGDLSPAAAEDLAARANAVDAVLFGPGMSDEQGAARLVRELAPRLERPALVLDAAALAGLAADDGLLSQVEGRVILTPHAGEMASMLGVERERITRDAARTARQAAARWGAVVALKGRETIIAAPDGQAYCNRAGNVGLATSGSGDTLAGVIAGLAARGAEPLQAAVWGVFLHACAGDRLAERMGQLGFLARELLAEIPPLMAELGSGR